MYYVYSLLNNKSVKQYFGRTKNPNKRLSQHLRLLERGKHFNVLLQEDFNSSVDFILEFNILGESNSFDVICSLEESLIAKARLVGKTYNIGVNSVGGDNISKHPNNLKIRVAKSIAAKNYRQSLGASGRKFVFGRPGKKNGMYGKTHTDQVRTASSNRAKGNSYSKGRVMSVEQKEAISARAKKRVGILNPFFGKSHSLQTKKALSDKRKGKSPSNVKPISIDGVVYPSVTDAAKALSVCPGTIIFRIKSKNFKYSYV